MREIKDRLADVDRVEFPRELWAAAVARAAHDTADERPAAPSARPTSHRIATIAVAFAVFAAATLVLWDALGPGSSRQRPSDTTPVINPLSLLPAGWNELPDPPDVRAGAAAVWTGSRLLVWGGYVYTGFSKEEPLDDGYLLQVETGEHEPLFVSPLEPRANAASAWSGSELLVWGGSDLYGRFFYDGAAYEPALRVWRKLPDAPLTGREPFSVWTGAELIVWGSRARDQRLADGAAYDPQTDSWRRIADAPAALTDATAVWSGQEMIVLGSALDERNTPETATAMGMAYDPAADRWRTLPETRLSPNASTAAWSGHAVVAWDYLNNSQTYDPATNEWSDVSRVPLDEGECSPESVGVSTSIVGHYCGRVVLFDQGEWNDIAGSAYVGWGVELVAADPAALILGSNVDTGATTLLAYRVDASDGSIGAENASVTTFTPSDEWTLVLTTIDPNGRQDLPIVWAANVPFSPNDSTSGFPTNTVRDLPPGGILITVVGPREYTGDTVFPAATFPLTISQGFCSHDQYETQPAPHVSKCLVDVMVGDELLNVTLWFGMNDPSDEMYEEANAQLARLALPATFERR